MSEISNVPVRESVGAALHFLRANARLILIVAAVTAVVMAVLQGVQMAAPPVGWLVSILGAVVDATAYAALVAAALGLGAANLAQHGMRVFAAMVVIGFFLFIVFMVLSIPVMIVLFAGPLAPYVAELQAAGSDQGVVMGIASRIAEEQPGAIIAVCALYAAIWLSLTSRLYLAAPATVDQGRILSFETWAWTKGAMLRILAARLMLLAPAYVLVNAFGYLVGRLAGIDTLAPGTIAAAIQSNPAGVLAYATTQAFVSLAVYSSLEAGLSSYLYRGLKPVTAPLPGA